MLKTIIPLILFSLSAVIALGKDLTTVPLNPDDFTSPPQRSKPGILWFWSQTEMTDAVIAEQIQEMEDAGFGSVMMFPLQYEPKFYSDHFYERFAVVLAELKKRDMGLWMTVDSAIPTGHGSMKVVGGGMVNEDLTMEPREDLRAQILLHGPTELTGGKAIDLHTSFPAISNLPSTVEYQNGTLRVRKSPMLALTDGSAWTDYDFKTNLTANNWAGNPLIVAGSIENGVMFRWDKKTNSGYAWSLADKSELTKGNERIPCVRRAVYKDGNISQRLPSIKIDELVHGKDYVFEIKVKGSTIETYVDGKLVDTHEDSTYASGTVGLYTPDWSRSIYLDLEVKKGDEVLFTEDFTAPEKWLSWAPNAPIDEVFCVAAIPKKDGALQAEGILDLTETFQNKTAWDAPAGDWKLEYFMKRKAIKMPYNYPDLFNDEVILRHQQIIYEEMYRRFKDYMGTTIKGFWSDEPHRTDDDVWSENFPVKFEKKGVKVAETLAAVYNDLGRKGKALRAPYFKEVYEGWTEPFAKLQGNWCKERGLDWMTNPTCDSAPPYGGYTAGNALQMNQWSNAPGVDAIFGQILPDKRAYISRWATSSAHQHGNQYVLYEVYGGYGWDVTPDLIRYVNGFLMVRGCNRVSFHAYWSNPDEVGYAPPFDPSNTYWHAQDEINLWNGRLQEANLGKAISKVALLVPNSTQYADHLDHSGRLMNSHWGQAYYGLENLPICFDLIDESNINDNPIMKLKAEAVDGALKLGEQNYEVVVLPYAHTLSMKSLETLKAAAEKGAKIIAYAGLPTEEYTGNDEALQAEVKALFGENPSKTPMTVGKGWTAYVANEEQLAEVIAQAKVNVVEVSPANPKIQTLKRVRESGNVYIFMNESEETTYSTITFNEYSTPEIWDPETGEMAMAPVFSQTGEQTHLPLVLTPYQLQVVVFPETPADLPHVSHSPVEISGLSIDETTITADVLTRKTGEFTIEGEHNEGPVKGAVSLGELPAAVALTDGWKMSYADKPEEIKDGLGDWSKERPKYSGSATYKTSFNFPTEGKTETLKWELDLGNVRDVADVTINGKALPTMIWRPYTADITDLLQAGANEISVTVSNTLGNRHQDPVPSGLIGGVALKPLHSVKVKLTK